MCQNLWDGRAGETCHFVLWSTSYEQKPYDGIQQLRAKCHIRLKNLFICGKKTRTSPLEMEIWTSVANIVAWGNDVLWRKKKKNKKVVRIGDWDWDRNARGSAGIIEEKIKCILAWLWAAFRHSIKSFRALFYAYFATSQIITLSGSEL